MTATASPPSDRLTDELLAGEYFATYHKKEWTGCYCFGTAARINGRRIFTE